MADVQIDNGEYTRIANIILEKIAAAKLNGCQYAIVLVVWRFTYGFQRKEHDLSPSFISTGTGYNKRQVEREISKLVSRNIITQKSKNGITRILGFNKDYESWDATYGKLADGESADGGLAVGEKAVGGYGELAGGTYGKLAVEERNKENSKETLNSSRHSRKNVFGVYQVEIGELSEMIKEELIELELEYSEEWVKQAIKTAVMQDVKKMSYIKGALKRWKLTDHPEPWTLEKSNVTPFPKGGQPNAKHGTGHAGRTDAELNAMSF
jgi:phage replication O-like protein O